jgi:hypothetical protein
MGLVNQSTKAIRGGSHHVAGWHGKPRFGRSLTRASPYLPDRGPDIKGVSQQFLTAFTAYEASRRFEPICGVASSPQPSQLLAD